MYFLKPMFQTPILFFILLFILLLFTFLFIAWNRFWPVLAHDESLRQRKKEIFFLFLKERKKGFATYDTKHVIPDCLRASPQNHVVLVPKFGMILR